MSFGPEGYIQICNENDTVTFEQPTDIAYGANGQYVFQRVVGTITFNNATFGDPIFGTYKGGFKKNVSTPDPPPQIKYDCINGACIDSTQYKTPGIYTTLEECQANCGNGKDCKPCCVYKVECN